jgi:hypothetical protein
MTVAGWYPDPLGRAQVRYWDGQAWSPWVANDGVSLLDVQAQLANLGAPSDIAPPSPVQSGYGWVLAPQPQFRSLRGLATALTWVLLAEIAASLARIGALANRLDVYSRYFHGDFSAATAVQPADDAVTGSTQVHALFLLAVFVLLVVFLYRAAKNTELWSSQSARWTPGWTIAGWFIPIANLVIPFLVVRDIWRRSFTPPTEPQTSASVSPLLWWWWVTFVVGYVALLISPSVSTLHSLNVRDGAHIAALVVLLVSAVLLIIWVRRLSVDQHARSVPTPV